jgi:hypothetical protein
MNKSVLTEGNMVRRGTARRSPMSQCRKCAAALVAVIFFVPSNGPLVAAAGQQIEAGWFRQKSRLARDLKLRARATERLAQLNPPGAMKMLISQLSEAQQRAATFRSGDEAVAAKVKALAPKLDRVLRLAEILEASASARSSLLRQLPSAAGVLASLPKPTGPSSSRRAKASDTPDGSDGTRSGSADLCEDDEGWSECATDQDIEDGLIQYYAVQAELQSAESDLDGSGQELENYCNANPEECYEYSPAQSPQPLPINLEDGAVDDSSSCELSDAANEGNEGADPCEENPVGCCVAFALLGALGIDEANLKQGEFFDALTSAIRPSKRNLIKLGLRAAGWSLTAIWAVYEAVDCVMNLDSEPIPVALAAYRADDAVVSMSMGTTVLA